MPNYSLTKPEEAYLNIEIDKKVYQVPLGRTLSELFASSAVAPRNGDSTRKKSARSVSRRAVT